MTDRDRETLERAEKMLDDLCNGRQRWRMSIPAQPETDPDLVIGRGLAVNRSLLEKNERLRAEAVSSAPPYYRRWQEQKNRIEAALILLPEQPEAAMNVLRGEE